MGTVNEVLQSALALPEEQRQAVALQLLDSLDSLDAPDPHANLSDDELAAEIARRANDAAAGRTVGIPWEEALDRVRRTLDA